MAFDADPMFERCFEETGFVDAETNQPQEGDLVFMRLGDSPGLNHVGVYVGEQRLLHHVKGRLSSRDIWGGYYQKNTGRIVRYRGGSEMMRVIKVYGKLAKHLGQRSFKAVVRTPGEAVKFLLANFPELRPVLSEGEYMVSVGRHQLPIGDHPEFIGYPVSGQNQFGLCL